MEKYTFLDFICEETGLQKGAVLSVAGAIFTGIGGLISLINANYVAEQQQIQMKAAVKEEVGRQTGRIK